MNSRVDGRQTAVDVIFVVAEAIAWYIILRVGATAMEQSYLAQVDDRVRTVAGATDVAAGRAADVLSMIRAAMAVEHGPSLLIVLAAAFGGFYLMRTLVLAGFDGALGAVILVASSVLALNALLHVALLGDARIWDASGIAALFGGSAGPVSAGDLGAFLDRPDLARPHGSTVTFMFAGMVALWVRFVIAGRSRVTFERVLRSFTAGFILTIIGLALASIEGVRAVAFFAVPQFVVGILGLAVANNARTVAPLDGTRRTGPWIASVGGTIGVLLAVAMLLGSLAFLRVGVLLAIVGDAALNILSAVLLAILTPIYWVIERIVRLLLPNGAKGFPTLPNLDMTPPPEVRDQAGRAAAEGMPLWLQNGLRFLAVAVVMYLVYRLALLIMRRGRVTETNVEESRGQSSGGTGLGGLLRNMLSRVRPRADDAWIRAQPIYRLYARAAAAAEERGFHYRLGETPLEFAARADRAMTAPPFPPIGLAFDRARYGRHLPDEGQVRSLEAAFGSWEAATPITEELRQRLAGSEALAATQEFMLHWTARRQAIAGHRSRRNGNQPPPEDSNTSRQSGEQVI